jgi:hypothetical protein
VLKKGKGDYLARLELLGKLLCAVDEKPYILIHGIGKEEQGLILLRLKTNELAECNSAIGHELKTISVGKNKFVPLSLKPGTKAGTVDKALYDHDKKRWTASIRLSRYK